MHRLKTLNFINLSTSFNPPKGDVREALPGAGGAPGAPPIFLCSGATKRSKIMFPHNFGSFPTDLSLFQNFFSTNHKKNAKIENILKIAKKWAKFQNFTILDQNQHIMHQKKAFFMQNSISYKKVWFLARKYILELFLFSNFEIESNTPKNFKKRFKQWP